MVEKTLFIGIEIIISISKNICENLLYYKKDLFSSIIDKISNLHLEIEYMIRL